MTTSSSHHLALQFPTHNAPRVWLITSGDSPIGISLARSVLSHGDYVVSGIIPSEFERDGKRSEEFKGFLAEVGAKSIGPGTQGWSGGQGSSWRERLRIVGCDVRIIGQCQAAVAEAVKAFGRVDILLCGISQAAIGTVEEFGQSHRTQMLVRDQFETNFFGPVNIIKATLPQMRHQKIGHMIILGGITGHLGTPGLGMYCASEWALEGFCDSIAYEIAPFNIKLTIIQASMEIGILTNRIVTAPPHPAYSPENNGAPLFRNLMDGLLNRLPEIKAQYPQSPPPSDITSPSRQNENDSEMEDEEDEHDHDHDHEDHDSEEENLEGSSPFSSTSRELGPSLLSRPEVVSLYPPLSQAHTEKLIAETLHALIAIGGHENPPARHIVGFEGVASVKEKLKTVSEELEDFVEVSAAVDVDRVDGGGVRRKRHGGDGDDEDADGPIDFGVSQG